MAETNGESSSPAPLSPVVASPMAPDSQPSDDDGSDMQSLTDSVTDYPVEWGRTYHRYKEDSYLYPNDPEERERMNLMLACMKRLHHGKLFLSPVKNPEKVLDIGTGTGLWAIDVADMFPRAKVIGTDLSAIQPPDVPPNVFFEISDCTDDDWGLKLSSFDLIHTGFMLGALPSFCDLVTKSKGVMTWRSAHSVMTARWPLIGPWYSICDT
jgi:SAM-dependent methyltransferase